jgi:hypothetical protein
MKSIGLRGIGLLVTTVLLTVAITTLLASVCLAGYSHLTSGPWISGGAWTLQVQDTTTTSVGTAEFKNSGGDSYLFSTQFFHTDSPYWHSWNFENLSADGDWSTSVSSTNGVITVKGTSARYTVTRNMSYNATTQTFSMTELYSSRVGYDIALPVNYFMTMENISTTNQSNLAGVPFAYNDATRTSTILACGPNPTMFQQQTNSYLALVVDDDFMRQTMHFYQLIDTAYTSTAYNQSKAYNEHFGLPANGTHSFNFVFYTMQAAGSCDYWGFINRLRSDWGVNNTCIGPFTWDQHLDMTGRDYSACVLCPWFHFLDGAGWMDATYDSTANSYINLAMTTIANDSYTRSLAAAPKFLCKIETNSLPVNWTTIANGSALVGGGYPVSTNWYWLEPLTAGQTTTLQTNATAKMVDDSTLWYNSAKSQQVVETQYIGPWPGSTDTNPQHWLDLSVYPAPTPSSWRTNGTSYTNNTWNGQTTYMSQMINHCLSYSLSSVPTQCTKGMWLDSYTLDPNFEENTSNDPGVNWNARWDYGQWDGYTVNPVTSGNGIAVEYTDACLVGIPARAALINYVTSPTGYNCFAFTNGHPTDSVSRTLPGKANFSSLVETYFETLPTLAALQNLLSTGEPGTSLTMVQGHLWTPESDGVYYGDPTFNTTGVNSAFGQQNVAAIQNKYNIMCLRNGTLMQPYVNYVPSSGTGSGGYGIINLQYPFTPVELHCGYLIGKEKILTAVSGTFYWSKTVHTSQPATCKVFDSCGNAVSSGYTFTPTDNGDGRWKVVLALPHDWNNTCAIW